MEWEKKGLIYCPDGNSSWAKHSALQPTPVVLDNKIIRVYLGFRDDLGISRIGFVDVDTDNPSNVIKVSTEPVLDIGNDGCFDENGVVPCAVIRKDENILFMYYAGYQLGSKVRFLAFGGLAISYDNGYTFHRYSKIPITERTNDEFLFRVIHSVLYDDHKWKVWYGAGSNFIQGNFKTLPVYNIRYMESDDGITFPNKGTICLKTINDEYRVGRPCVFKHNNKFIMLYGKGSEEIPYILGMAESVDGLNWERIDSKVGIYLSDEGWDSQMMAYPSIIDKDNEVILFYNGNDYGKTGFGYAVLKK